MKPKHTLFRDVNGNLSSKRIIGAVTYSVGLSMAVAGGFSFYNIDPILVLSVLSNGTVLLGLGTFERKQPT